MKNQSLEQIQNKIRLENLENNINFLSDLINLDNNLIEEATKNNKWKINRTNTPSQQMIKTIKKQIKDLKLNLNK